MKNFSLDSFSLPAQDTFSSRHIGPNMAEQESMLAIVGYASLQTLMEEVVPKNIQYKESPLNLEAASEADFLKEFSLLGKKNKVFRSYLGMGYYDCITPGVILRNILENPGWYTQYTPYQAEIAQGRLEALLNYQTVITELTALPIANASLLDEGTAAAEAMAMMYNLTRKGDTQSNRFLVSSYCHPQTLAVLNTRAKWLGIEIFQGDLHIAVAQGPWFGALIQYPDSQGKIEDWQNFCDTMHAQGGLVAVATDLLALCLLSPPGDWGADIALGSSQRFGVPMGFGGPHAAFFATREEYKRLMPGRLIGMSIDSKGNPALRMALQTREQHIRREKATSNICTAQVLLAIISGMYAVYHGPEGLKRIAMRVHGFTRLLAEGLKNLGLKLVSDHYFDTITVTLPGGEKQKEQLRQSCEAAEFNLCFANKNENEVGLSVDERSSELEVTQLLSIFAQVISGSGDKKSDTKQFDKQIEKQKESLSSAIPAKLLRQSKFLLHPVFHNYHSETSMLRYIKQLEERDLSLAFSMIPLGSCTMKLNATSEMIPVTWPEWNGLHPFSPASQTEGYAELCNSLEQALAKLTGFSAVSLQPNAGSQGEYAGLLVIRAWQESRGEGKRDIVLIPASAHGTNPATASMAGCRVIVVACDEKGNVKLDDLEAKAREHQAELCALMVTYPSTHGVFEEGIQEICNITHKFGGQVYMDGANMNAQVAWTSPGKIGADVCHLNLHKTFCIPHGGGGPGMGPICVANHLAPFLPGHPLVQIGVSHQSQAIDAVSSAPWGSASILPISWAYIRMMGSEGLKQATAVAILNANYIRARLEKEFKILYTAKSGLVAHELILDCRPFKQSAKIEVEDIAKRLMDYGFHAPTVSFPVAGTLMIEPTESENKEELDRFCEAMLSIRAEIREIESGKSATTGNVLKNAPHTLEMLTQSEWKESYSREKAAFPLPWVRSRKFWPSVSRVDAAYGDKNLVCSCPPVESYAEDLVVESEATQRI